jgi:hypothetical protein
MKRELELGSRSRVEFAVDVWAEVEVAVAVSWSR